MIKFHVKKSDREFIKPAHVKRASRLAVNQITNEMHKELGGEIPRAHGTSVTGYRRVRSKKNLAKARAKRLRALVWQGTLRIPAKYAGKPRKVTGGVKAGKHYFPNAFIATMKNGYTGVFKRITGSSKLEQEYIELEQAQKMVRRKAQEKLPKLQEAFRYQYKKLIKNKKGKK